MDRERLDDWCERGILFLVLAILVVGPLGMGGVDAWDYAKGIPHSRSWQFLALAGLTLGVMALWLARWWLEPPGRLLWPPICWAVLAFAVYAIVRYRQADIEYVARQELIRVLLYAFLFFAILNNLHRQGHAQVITLTLVFLGMALSFYAIWQFLGKTGKVWNLYSAYPGRGSGTFIYPNTLAAFLEMIVPLGLSCALMGRLPHVMKVFAGYASLIMLAGIGVTMSRGGWLVATAALACLCGVMLLQRGYRLRAVVLALALALAGWWVVPRTGLVQERMQGTFQSGQADDVRLSIWRAAIEMWQDNQLWGVGPGHFDQRFPQYRPVEVQRRPGWVHNDYLNTLADWGAMGAALAGAAWALLFWGVFRIWRALRGKGDEFERRRSNRFALLTGASVGLIAILMHSAMDFNLHIPAVAILAVTLMALLSGQMRYATEHCWFIMGGMSRLLATAVLVCGLGYLGYQTWRGAREWQRLQVEAARAPNASSARIAALERALAVEPMNFETTYAIGECYRLRSFRDESKDPDALAGKAMEWFERGMKLNPYDSNNWLRYGMCLDRIAAGDPKRDSSAYYLRADELDPNWFFTAANMGWHYFQLGDYAAARSWLERSRRLEWRTNDNEIAYSLGPIVERRLKENAERNK